MTQLQQLKRIFLTAPLCAAAFVLLCGCWRATTSYHSSRMLGLAHGAELHATESKRAVNELREGNQKVQDELTVLRSQLVEVETEAARCRSRLAPISIPKKTPTKSRIITAPKTPAHNPAETAKPAATSIPAHLPPAATAH